ncbi:hypothetical protein SAMN04489761_3950 [Tenacibaculum sp. MAR_2009_124]|uniref:hypothetical protein n=1 Tax=Tenacibaculum sp. MAR_2009_124 TaxID=1250059 RepID=UPI000896A65F|nr:hypothetical protein [Tenacibaculum sp. MAR_2009_124]SEC91480.1 hypothetical protein SAMN04489761_3950 [Tenacibaculum sp. MAR_2009_124]
MKRLETKHSPLLPVTFSVVKEKKVTINKNIKTIHTSCDVTNNKNYAVSSFYKLIHKPFEL